MAEALRLADELDDIHTTHVARNAAAELRRLHTDAEESEALRERLSALLRNTAIALRGPEPELTRWSWHDLPELATALKAELLAMRRVFSEAGCTFDVAYIRRLVRAEAASCSNTFDCQCPKHFASQQSEQRPKRVLTAVWRDRAQRAEAQRDVLLEALKYHQEQTRPIQRTLDVIKAVEEGK